MPVGASLELPANAERVAAALRRAGWQRFAANEAGEAYLAECRRPDGFRRPRRGHVRAWSLPGSPTTRVRLVRVPRLDDGGDRVPAQDRRGASLAGSSDRRASRPDRRPSRPVVSPTYAQGSCYGTNRVVAGAPGRFTGPATPLLSTARAAQPSGRYRRRSRCSVVRTGRVSLKNRSGGRGGAGGGGRRATRAGGRDNGHRTRGRHVGGRDSGHRTRGRSPRAVGTPPAAPAPGTAARAISPGPRRPPLCRGARHPGPVPRVPGQGSAVGRLPWTRRA